MRPRRALLTLSVVLTLCAWCAWVSGFRQSTKPAFAAWAVSLAAVVAIDLLLWRERRKRRPGLRLLAAAKPWPRPGQGGGGRVLLGMSPWLGLGLLVLAWELLGIDTGPSQTHLTISALALALRPIEAALLLVWMLIGLGYGVARARAPMLGPPSEADRGQVAAVPVIYHTPVSAFLLPQNRAVGVTFWLLILAAAVLADIAARRSGGRLATAEESVRLISSSPLARIFLVAAWTGTGWHLFAH